MFTFDCLFVWAETQFKTINWISLKNQLLKIQKHAPT